MMTPQPLSPLVEFAARLIRLLPKGRQRLLSRLVSAPTFFAKFPGSRIGLEFECSRQNQMVWHVFCTGHYEVRETTLLMALLKPGETFVDVGANWGYFTLRAAERVGPSGFVVAIEADPRNHALLGRNVSRNHLAQVTTIQAAAGSVPGTLPMVGYSEAQANRGVSYIRGTAAPAGAWRMVQPGAVTVEVRADTIDALLDGVGVGRVDLLKMDIEGAEALALPGMRDGLAAGRYRRIVVELHANALGEYGSNAASLLTLLRDAGYRLWSVAHDRLEPLEPGASASDRSEFLALAPGAPDPPPRL